MKNIGSSRRSNLKDQRQPEFTDSGCFFCEVNLQHFAKYGLTIGQLHVEILVILEFPPTYDCFER